MSYIYAIVKIPIKLMEDGTHETLNDRIYTTIEPCDELPPVNKDQNNDISEKLQTLMQSKKLESEPESEPEPEPESEPEPEPEPEPEIKLVLDNPNKSKKNTTFRNHKSMTPNITKKIRLTK
jgi:hypothetical protein